MGAFVLPSCKEFDLSMFSHVLKTEGGCVEKVGAT